MDDQISTSISTVYENGRKVKVTGYVGGCGCAWLVDMWGNVRSVYVCSRCMKVDRHADQLLFFDLTPEPAAAESKATPHS